MDVRVRGPVLVTGAASGIGRAVVDIIAADGVSVALLDRTPRGAEDAARQLSETYDVDAIGLDCDVASEASVADAYSEVGRLLGIPVGFVLNAGIEAGAPIRSMQTEVWDAVIGTNLRGAFFCLRAALQMLEKADLSGSIVLTGSPAASVAFRLGGNAAYAASKAGLAALARCAAIEAAPAGIRVNVVVPGATRTKFLEQLDDSSASAATMSDVLTAEIPLHRLASPDEPAAAIAWLLSDAASYVTGSQLVCDGGVLALASISA